MPKRRRLLVFSSVALVGLLTVALVGTHRIDANLREEQQKLRDLGVPMTTEELDAAILMLEDNAAGDIDAAYALLTETAAGNEIDAIRNDPKRKVAFADNAGPLFEAIEKAADNRHAYWTSDKVEPKWLRELFYLHIACMTALEVYADRGDVESAVRAMRAADIVGSFGTGRLEAISPGFAAVQGSSTLWRTADLFSTVSGDAEKLKLLLVHFESDTPRYASWRWIMIGEAVGKPLYLRHADFSQPIPYADPDRSYMLLMIPAVRKAVEASVLSAARETFESMPSEGADWRLFRDSQERVLERLRKDRSITGALALKIWGDENLGVDWAHLESPSNLKVAATRILLFRLKHGRLPTKLAEADAALEDCVDGQDLRYLPGPSSFKVYSVGLDGADGSGDKVSDWTLEIDLPALP